MQIVLYKMLSGDMRTTLKFCLQLGPCLLSSRALESRQFDRAMDVVLGMYCDRF